MFGGRRYSPSLCMGLSQIASVLERGYCISRTVGVRMPHQAKLCILCIYPQNFIIPSRPRTQIDFGLLQARGMIALCWKKNRYAFDEYIVEGDGILCGIGETDLHNQRKDGRIWKSVETFAWVSCPSAYTVIYGIVICWVLRSLLFCLSVCFFLFCLFIFSLFIVILVVILTILQVCQHDATQPMNELLTVWPMDVM